MQTALKQKNIETILAEKSVFTVFHPIVSMTEQRIIGCEALSRGIDPESGDIIPPLQLFHAASESGSSLELDRLCRHIALLTAAEQHRAGRLPLVFINLDLAHLPDTNHSTGYLLQQVEQAGLQPQDVAIEIVESGIPNTQLLIDFVRRYREAGFLIVLDDFGADHSNLDRILLVQPDILKIDRNLIEGLEADFYRRSIIESITNLAHRTGSLVLAEGVESEAELATCCKLGLELFQGYYFGRPDKDIHSLTEKVESIIQSTAQQMYHELNFKMSQAGQQTHKYYSFAREIIDILSVTGITQLETALCSAIQQHPFIECAYCLDNEGTQITETVFPGEQVQRHSLFRAAHRGSNHSLKPYFITMHDQMYHLSDLYISRASGNHCRTLSMRFSSPDSKDIILCLDLREEAM